MRLPILKPRPPAGEVSLSRRQLVSLPYKLLFHSLNLLRHRRGGDGGRNHLHGLDRYGRQHAPRSAASKLSRKRRQIRIVAGLEALHGILDRAKRSSAINRAREASEEAPEAFQGAEGGEESEEFPMPTKARPAATAASEFPGRLTST